MGDVSIPEPDQSRVGAKVDELIASGHEFYATAVTGVPHGRVRRPTLFVIAAIGTVGALAVGGIEGVIAGAVGLIAILLLALSDNVVEL